MKQKIAFAALVLAGASLSGARAAAPASDVNLATLLRDAGKTRVEMPLGTPKTVAQLLAELLPDQSASEDGQRGSSTQLLNECHAEGAGIQACELAILKDAYTLHIGADGNRHEEHDGEGATSIAYKVKTVIQGGVKSRSIVNGRASVRFNG